MTRTVALSLAALLTATSATSAAPNGPTVSDAERLLRVKADEAHTTTSVWNGERTVFVDYLTGPQGEADRPLFAVQQVNGRLRAVKVTIGEQNGGDAEVAAIGFANADRDAQKELVVILTWSVNHYDVGGTFYEVQLFDDLKPGQTNLTPLAKLTRHFGSECDCTWRDGNKKNFRFKTVAQVRRELTRMGY